MDPPGQREVVGIRGEGPDGPADALRGPGRGRLQVFGEPHHALGAHRLGTHGYRRHAERTQPLGGGRRRPVVEGPGHAVGGAEGALPGDPPGAVTRTSNRAGRARDILP